MIININDLDQNTLFKIPLSIRLSLKDEFLDTNILPINIAYELRNVNSHLLISPFSDKKTIDLIPILNIYTDFKTITSKKQAVIEYVKNFLQIDKGDYPFDPTFGTDIKKIVQMLDTETAKTAIDMELNGISDALSLAFDVVIKLMTSSVSFSDFSNHFEYNIKIELQVDDFTSSILLTKTTETYYLM